MPLIKVLHILSDLEPGGAQYAVLDLVSHLDKNRFRAQVCCLRSGGALVGKLRERGIPFHLCYFGSRLSPWGLYNLKNLIAETGAHVVHTHLRRANHAGRLAAVLARCPVICAHYHDTLRQEKLRQKWLTRWLGRRTDRVFCVSGGVRAACSDSGDEPEDRLALLHNFVEPSDYQSAEPPAVMKAELGIPADVPVVGIVGRLHPFKNHEAFLLMARRLVDEDPAIHFAVVGDGELKESLRDRARQLGISANVTFTGNRNDMARVYRALDALVLCSTREGFGKVILEAQAAGVPVVAAEIGGVGEVMAGGGGYLVRETDRDRLPLALAAAVDHAIQPENRAALLRQARENITRFSPARIITELEDVYTELCETKRAFAHIY